MKKEKTFNIFARNFIFGVEDGLVSTVGVISGIAIAGMPKFTILATGIILIFVEAFSMGAGSFLSEHSAKEYESKKHSRSKTQIIGGIIMFFSYFIVGLIPLFPYALLNIKFAFWLSIISSILALFFILSGWYSKG